MKQIKVFHLARLKDVSGVSGLGIVAEGVTFSDGVSVLRWLTAGGSTAVYDSIESVKRIHGHQGGTRVSYLPKKQLKMLIKQLSKPIDIEE